MLAVNASFSELFRQHAPHVGRALRNLGVGEADLPDALEETFLDVHRKLPGFHGESSLRTWIYGIGLRVAGARRRPRGQSETAPEELPMSTRSPTPHEQEARRQDLARLDAALDELDADQRAAFVLYELEELTLAEIAIAVGEPVPTIDSRLQAARKRVVAAFRSRALATDGGHS